MTSPKVAPVRLVVTGHSATNQSRVLIDGAATNVSMRSEGVASTTIWHTERSPANIAIGDTVEDMGARNIGFAPPKTGSRLVVIDFPPNNPRWMHRTETLDYVIVLSGSIDMEMDESTISLRAGDIVIQRGTNHAWCNRTDRPARLAVVLLDAEPLGIGDPTGSTP